MDNITKIKYVAIGDKIYVVDKLSFYHMSMMLMPCDMEKTEIPEDEVFPLDELKADFKIEIIN